ncbi:hypothetical protein K7432_013745 [Basidiobolus ranarum]|uniref:SUN domain-containing protein n=1 Tax=Basidiobolus ranarum TaxID=34480 RepID=A0ABR2VQJ1_9FUNG
MLAKMHLPTIEVPEFTLHKLLPEFNWPTFEFAKLNIPRFEVPELNWPVFQLPKLNFPKFDLPTFSLPQMNLPEFSLPLLPQFDLSAWSLSNLLPEFSWPDFSRLNPFSSEPIPVRRAPSSKTISEFHNRLAELEASIRDLAIVASVLMDESETMPLPGSHTSLSREKLISDLSNIRRKLKSELEIASVQQEVIQSLAGTIASREKELTAIEHQVEGMRSDVKFVDSQVQESDQSIEKVYNHLSQLNNELARASDWNTVKKQVIKTLESELPNHLVAQQSEDGSIILSSEFYAHLVRSLLTKDQADRLVAEEIENQKQHIPSHDHKLRWTEFFGANKHQLSHLVQQDLEDEVKRYTDIGVIVHKDDFLSVVESHLEELKLRLSSHVDMDVAIVEKEMEKELEITHQEREERKQQYRQSVRLIEEMIQNSLVKYTADTIARPDFALYYSGARVVTELTSPSYLPQSGSTFDKFAQILGMNTLKYGNPPAMAMYPDTHLGKCWAFSGTQGQLTIQLSRTINATDFTIEHVDQQVAIDLRSAPKELEVYGLVANSGDEDEPKNFEEFLLARYEYDTAQNRIQTFSVDPHQKVYKPVKYVQLRVLSNHGHPDFTCIYRFRVHGKLSNE